MKRSATLRNARLLQLIGILVALVGLVGFWVTHDVERAPLSEQQRELLGIDEDDFHASFVVAGRDVFYEPGKSTPIYGRGGRIVGWDYHGVKTAYGTQTDTILYLSIINDAITMIALPRDVFVGAGKRKINSIYQTEGAEGLRRQVAELLGVPVDYYAIVNLDIFKHAVDALGGVEVNVPERMYYVDRAGGLHIDLQPGLQVLDGEGAAGFVRYRQFQRGDIDRLDNVKRLAYAVLARLKSLNVRAVARVPELVDTVLADVETNASPALVRRLLPRLNQLVIQETATLPTVEVARGDTQGLEVDAGQVEAFLAAAFGGESRDFAEAPDATLLITNRSGAAGLAEWYRRRLVALGVPDERILTREASADPSPTRLLATVESWQQADYYTTLLHTGKQQIDRFPVFDRTRVELELVLGEDAPGRDAARLEPTAALGN